MGRITMKPFTLGVPGASLAEFSSPEAFSNRDGRCSWATANFDAFTSNILIGWDDKRDSFSQNHATSSVRIFPQPGFGENYLELAGQEVRLHDEVARAIYASCRPQFSKIKEFILSTDDQPSIHVERTPPEEWQGKHLVIPIEFLHIRNIKYNYHNETTWVEADIQIGHYMIFFNVVLMADGIIRLRDTRFLDDNLLHEMSSALDSYHELRNAISRIYSAQERLTKDGFLLAAYNFTPKDKIPRLYFE